MLSGLVKAGTEPGDNGVIDGYVCEVCVKCM